MSDPLDRARLTALQVDRLRNTRIFDDPADVPTVELAPEQLYAICDSHETLRGQVESLQAELIGAKKHHESCARTMTTIVNGTPVTFERTLPPPDTCVMCNQALSVEASRDDLAGQVARLTEERDALRAELMTDRGTEIVRASVAEKLKDRAEAEVATMRGEVARLTQALRDIEWAYDGFCPKCFSSPGFGHTAICTLSAALRGATEERS